MAINWKLRTYLTTKHSIYSVTEFKKLIVKKTGIVISLQNLTNIVNKKPMQIRLETIEIICSALNCNLNDFLEVKPKIFKNTEETKKLSYKNTPNCKKGIKKFPDPKDYV